MTTLVYWEIGAGLEGVRLHPIKDMERLGIKFESVKSFPIADQAQFFNCTNIPDKLPSYIEIKEI